MATYAAAPSVGIIDASNNLTLSWTPYPDGNGSFSQYDHWVVTVDSTPYTVTPVWFNPPTDTILGTQTFTQTLNPGSHTVTMQGFNSSSAAVTDPWETNAIPAARVFPDALTQTDVSLSLSSVLLGQAFTLSLSTIYSGADQWQVLWPDNTSTGWLSLSSNSVVKSFSTPGNQTIVVQTRKDYSGTQYNPPVSLIRQVSVQIYVIDQQAPGTSSVTGGLTGDLGIGGQQGFEIVDASSPTAVPNAWEVIARAFVRDTVTNELKLLVATSRFGNASSLLGTMAVDVFPVEGRPHSIELITPPYELTTTSSTESIPVKIGTSAVPNLIVGKSIAQALGGAFAFTTKSGTGISPFLWTATGLPAGVTISSSGVLTGIPLELGVFSPTFAVQDSSVPFSIDEVTLTTTVITDLAVRIAAGQTDNSPTPQVLSQTGTSLGIAQVGTPYKVQMQVGNINSSSSVAGGLAPYTWSIPAGALPIGLTIDPNTGIISGSPCTYNSTSDYGLTYTAVVQVTDAIGAKATQTYTMKLRAADLQVGPLDQPTIFALQEFVLNAPVFGGLSPYTVNFDPAAADQPYFGTAAFTDGQEEIPVGGSSAPVPGGFPSTSVGGHQFTLQITDSTTPSPLTILKSVSFQVSGEIADIRIVQANAGHEWGYNDTFATTMPVAGNFTGYTLGGTTLTLTSVAQASGSPLRTVYTGTIGSTYATYVGEYFTISGFTNSVNNGSFICTAATATTLTLANTAGVTESHSGKAILNIIPPFSSGNNGIGVAVDSSTVPPEVNVTGFSTGGSALTYSNAQSRVELDLTQGGTNFGGVSREFTWSVHNDSATPGDIGVFTAYPRPYIVNVDVVALNPRKPYFNNADTVPATISGFTARVQTNSSLPPGLSLDANTGLVYGPLVGLAAGPSVIEYVDSGGTVHGTVTINWATYQSNFQPTNPGNLVSGGLGVSYTTANGLVVFTAPAGVTLSNPQVVYPQSNGTPGSIPGMTLTLNNSSSGNSAIFTGTPTVAGYYDFWIQVQGGSSQVAYVYQRVIINYAPPLLILTSGLTSSCGASTSLLPDISAQAMSAQFPPSGLILQGFGGQPPYTWSSPQFPSGAGTGNAAGLSLSTSPDSTGLITGQLTTPPASSPTALFTSTSPLVITMTDSRGATTSRSYTWCYNNNLRISTPYPNGIPPITNDPNGYSFQMLAVGGTPPYSWQITTPGSPESTLPTGVYASNNSSSNTWANTYQAQSSGGGAFSGAWPGTPAYTPSTFTIGVQDSALTVVSQSFTIQTGTPTLVISDTNVSTVNRGVPYQGTLSISGGYTTPISWSVAPVPNYPNTILSGLSLQANGSNGGTTASISGTYSGTPHQAEGIIQIVGNGTTATVYTAQSHGFTATQSVTIAGTAHFNGTYTVATVPDYASFTISASYNGTENPPSTATATVTANLYPIRVLAVDSASPANQAFQIVYLNTGTDLTVTTTGLPNATIGGSYSYALAASGGVSPYTWEVDPTSAATLTGTGLSLSSAGVISGSASGSFSNNITFRVTDSNSPTPNIAHAAFTLTSQASGLTITTASITPAISGRAYTFTLAASGDTNTPYTWSIASGSLPSGITLNASTGVISGTSTAAGFNQPITWKVTDSIGAYVTKVMNFSVVTGLSLTAGPDYVGSLSTGILGYSNLGQVTSINPRPNLSFYVVATNVQSTSPSQMSVTTNSPNITGTVVSLSNGVAMISLTGTAFDAGVTGSNSVSVSVTDSGTTATKTFTWVMYNDGVLRFGATLPTQLTS